MPAREPAWAFPVQAGTLPPEPPGPKSVEGSAKQYTPQQIDDLLNPPDWFPEAHKPAPGIVQKGHGGALACGACHLMSGFGHPESADLTGFTADYFVQQMNDFKAGTRKDYARMNGIAKELSDEEIRAGRRVVRVAAARQVHARRRGGDGAEDVRRPGPHALRRSEQPRHGADRQPDHHAAGGSGRRRGCATRVRASWPTCRPAACRQGRALATGGGGKTVACDICHGDGMKGLANVPRLAGLHPIYVARQLHLFKDGGRNGPDAPLMKKPVAALTDADILNLSAYLASLPPT